jgi:hypothetical protein
MISKASRALLALTSAAALGGVVFAQGSGSPGQDLRSMNGQTVTVVGCLMSGASAQPTGAAADSNFTLSNVQMRSSAATGSGSSASGGATASTAAAPPATAGNTPATPPATTSSAATAGGPTSPGATAPAAGANARGSDSGSRGMTLRLTQADAAQLTENVNKQVEVTGRFSASAGRDSGAGVPATATAGAATAGGGAPAGTGPGAAASSSTGTRGMSGMAVGDLQVQSIRTIGQNCSPQ